jgi:hypothetical protein
LIKKHKYKLQERVSDLTDDQVLFLNILESVYAVLVKREQERELDEGA